MFDQVAEWKDTYVAALPGVWWAYSLWRVSAYYLLAVEWKASRGRVCSESKGEHMELECRKVCWGSCPLHRHRPISYNILRRPDLR